MSSEIIFNKDFEEQTAFVMKTFDADVSEVWAHFTILDLLDLWWAPKPWKCETVSFDFKEGGIWHYKMVGPDGETPNAVVQINSITQHRSIEWKDDFADENGVPQNGALACTWLIGFTGVAKGTKLTVNLHFSSEESMKAILEMGFEEGFTATLNQLEDLLKGEN